MARARLTTAAFLWGDGQCPPDMIGRQVRQLAASDAVDYLSHSAQLWRFIPRQLWSVDNAPMAALVEDPESMQDAFLVSAYCHAMAPGLGISLLSDRFHSGPSRLTQTMSTLAHVTQGRAIFHLGASQLRQLEPIGSRRRRETRPADLPRIFERFAQDPGPFDHRRSNWATQAAWWLGGSRPFSPLVHAVGVDPVLVDHATSYADGLSVTVPCTWTSPEECATHIAGIREQLELKGRDPEAFRFGMFCPVLMHEDENVLDAALDNPIVRWIAARFSHIIQRDDWAGGGPLRRGDVGSGDDVALLERHPDDRMVDDVLADTTRADAESALVSGTPGQVAGRLAGYIEAGISFVSLADLMPVVGDPADAPHATDRSIACLGALKSAVGHGSAAAQPALERPGMWVGRRGTTWINTN